MSNPEILVIIPAYNEAGRLGGVIRDVTASIEADVVVIDDGSTDDTGAVAIGAGAELLRLPFNLGIGSAVQTGYMFALRQGYDVAIQVDGDGQHDASFLPVLIKPILSGDSDMAVGSRYLPSGNYEGSVSRRLGTNLFSRLLSLLISQRVTDATSGFRAVNRDLIELFAHDYPRDYPEVETLLHAYNTRFRIIEVPVHMRQRPSGSSSINSFRSVYYMIKVLLALAVGVTRRRTTGAADD